MSWQHAFIDQLATLGPAPYLSGAQPASEPTALAALALLGHHRIAEATPLLDWLAESQQPDGHVPVRRDPPRPGWTTALASLAWSCARKIAGADYQRPLDEAAAWMLRIEGKAAPRQPQFGHDSTLVGWPWVNGTHTWLEPTVFHVLAFSARGWSSHARAIEGRRVIADRVLPAGGANYGNTVVLGQMLLPHLQPSGLALLALADSRGVRDADSRIAATIAMLRREIGSTTAPASLCWPLMGLAAHQALPAAHAAWLATAAERPRLTPLEQALLLLADLGEKNPLVQVARDATDAQEPSP
ncbi:MAG: hypothetical protein KDB14_32495 [Planctomycetales bacterium]|nr:hypothetical protein [Planctomycetales bacterium]